MPYRFPCEHCDHIIEVRFVQMGDEVKCNSCGQRMIFPDSAEPLSDDEFNEPRAAYSSSDNPVPSHSTEYEGTMTAGSLLGDTFETFGNNFVVFMIINFICLIPAFVLGYTLMSGIISDMQSIGSFSHIQALKKLSSTSNLYSFAQTVLALVAQVAVVFSVVEFKSGHKVSIGEALTKGFSFLLPVIGVLVLTMLIIFGGLILFIIPGLIAAIALFVAIPVAVVEKPGVMNSLKRSWNLTTGYRWSIFWAYLLLGLINTILAAVMTVFILKNFQLYFFGTAILAILFNSLNSTMAAVGYLQLRGIKDNVVVDDLVDVFR